MGFDILQEAEAFRCRSANKAWTHVESFCHPRYPNFSLLVSSKGDSKVPINC